MNLQKPNYSAWLIDEKDFPQKGSIEQKIEFVSGYGILAPSQHNTQPWLFKVNGNTLTISYDAARTLAVGDPGNRGLFISLGACAENIVQAGEGFGLFAQVKIKSDTVLLSFKEGMPRKNKASQYVVQRHSDKGAYSGKQLSQVTLEELQTLQSNSIDCKLVTAPKTLEEVVTIHAKAAAGVADNLAFVRELVTWLRSNKTHAFDGMPGFITGMSNAKSVVGKVLLKKKPQLFKKAVAQDEKLMSSASLIAVWGVNGQKPEDFIECGRIIERFWLKAVELGLAAHPMTAIMGDKSARMQLAEAIGIDTQPVFLLRVGYHKDSGMRTPRRLVACN